MEMKRGKTSTEEFEKAAAKRDRAKHVLRLYVTGMTPKSTLAIANVQKLCEKYLAGRYELKVIDIDGVLAVSWELLDGAVEAVRVIREAGLPIVLLTNNRQRVSGRSNGIFNLPIHFINRPSII